MSNETVFDIKLLKINYAEVLNFLEIQQINIAFILNYI
jgi:hypothetical protein